MHLFVDISSHGLGHLAITAPVLNRLADDCPDLRLTLRSGLPENALRRRIRPPFSLIIGASDFGYHMRDALRIDPEASAAAYRRAHANWHQRVAQEADFLRRLTPDCVLTNVSYLPLAGARQAGIPAGSLCSLNWADLFAHYFRDAPWAGAIHTEMLSAYRQANAFLRTTPGMAMPALPNQQIVGPIAALGQRHDLGLNGARAILIALGGIPHRLPMADWPRLPGTRWIIPADWHSDHPDAITQESFGLGFTDLLCSVDAIITKPGYGTFTEAACNGTPVLYQRRDDWPEQACLIDWLHEHARCAEISGEALARGQLGDALDALLARTAPARPEPTGIRQAAEWLRSAGSRSA